MMKIDLIELLRIREICHPSRLTLLRSNCDWEVQVEVTGYPWWLQIPDPATDGTISFHFEGISDGSLGAALFEPDDYEESLEGFDVRPLAECEWARGAICEIYCNSPLVDPMSIFALLHDFLISVDCPYPADHYLTGSHVYLERFAAIAASRSFLLFRGPESICDFVCKELNRRDVGFNLIKGGDFARERVFVQLSNSYLICRSAYAVFEDEKRISHKAIWAKSNAFRLFYNWMRR